MSPFSKGRCYFHGAATGVPSQIFTASVPQETMRRPSEAEVHLR